MLCVYGSGFGMRPEDGFFRMVFLASPDELSDIYADIANFTRQFLRGPERRSPAFLPCLPRHAPRVYRSSSVLRPSSLIELAP